MTKIETKFVINKKCLFLPLKYLVKFNNDNEMIKFYG